MGVLVRAATAWGRFALKDVATAMKYAKVELAPPGPSDLVGSVKGVGNVVKDVLTFRWAQATMKEATVNTLVAAEIAGWFFIGECIGKGSLIGYQV
uniref:Mitochondrial ATP synthase subunit g n=1 Tax=Pseudodiaptomus poplesia TaxID=213370 RepID=A0A0U2IG99_9MAXI|nr:mitochondrial ATP synthase subunit g [Pseudodiaptomus poplesia]